MSGIYFNFAVLKRKIKSLMFFRNKILIVLLSLLLGHYAGLAQDVIAPEDSIVPILEDTTQVKNAAGLEAPVTYQAKDSIVMTAGNMAFLFGDGSVKYQQIELQSENIEMNMDSSIVFATFGKDTVGLEFGYPLFIDRDQQYESKTMRYNFKTKKGYITDVITQQGEGFVTAGRSKKMDDDAINMVGGRYTTCDDHDHPHFYVHMTRAKVRPNKNTVSGPVYLVIEDVPLFPIGLPFAFFPFSSSYSSGVLFPTFGDENARGFFLRDGGYYFALSDYMDLALTGDIYTKGSWALNARSTYKKRYKYSGSFNLSYQVTKLGDKLNGVPMADYSKSTDFRVNWSHSQDPKANPYRTLSASVNFSTSSFDRNNTFGTMNSSSGSGYNNVTDNMKSSTINMTQRFPDSPFSLSSTASVTQRMRDSSISMTLPDISVTMSRVFPFKRKKVLGAERWYEKISMSYTGYLRNSIDTKENMLMKSSLAKDWKNSFQHSIPISATFNAFNFINITPSVNYNESWHLRKIEKDYDPNRDAMVVTDTIYGFHRQYNYSGSVSASTTVYGEFKPLPFFAKIAGLPFGGELDRVRHRMEPSISYSMTPSFLDPKYGFYNHYSYTDKNGRVQEGYYSPFEGQQGVSPSSAKSSMLSFSLTNNIEAKIRTDNDSTGYKKISLIDNLSVSGSYNLAADSFQWSDMSVALRLKLSKSYTLNLNATFDTYTYDYNHETNRLVRQNVTRWEAGKGLGRLRSTGTSFSYTFNNDTFKKLFGKGSDSSKGSNSGEDMSSGEEGSESISNNTSDGENASAGGRLRGDQRKEDGNLDSDGYFLNSMPWSLSFSYNMSLGYNNSKINIDKKEYEYMITHGLSFNGNLQPTKNWRFNFNATYNFDSKKISDMSCNISRNLHCWTMSASFRPVGLYKSYSFSIAVSSSLLKDLKWDQRSSFRDGQVWY
jgi:Organic solvent tolerance protein OstA